MKIHSADPAAPLQFQWKVIDSARSIRVDPSQECHGDPSSSVFNPGSSDRRVGQVRLSKAGVHQPPCNRYHHAACRVGNHVYIYGGKDRYSPLKDLWRLDVVTGQWESLAPWGVDLPHLQGHTMATYRSQVLIFGGSFSESLTEETPLWIINTDLHCWRKYRPDTQSCARPAGRREHSCVVFKNSMYIYGGFSDSGGSTDEFWAFNIEEEVWRLIRQRKPGKRHGHVAVVMGGHMWVHGGMKRLKALSDLWTYNFSMCSWNAVKSLGVSPALSNHTAHVVKNYLMLLGGFCQSKPMNSIWLFQFDTVSWRQITVNNSEWCSPISLHCSLVLGSSVQEASPGTADRSRSVPQLKTQGRVQAEDRPWTSPCQDLGHTGSNVWPATSALKPAEVLQLESFQSSQTMVIDKNNNASEEDLTHEAETSFFAPMDFPHEKDAYCLDKFLWSKNEGFCTEMNNSSHPPSVCTAKIRPASEELCYDKFPLLQSFQSVNSDTTLGKTNLTLTLSDEQISQKKFPVNIKNTMLISQSQQTLDYGLPISSQSTSLENRVFKSTRCDFINPLYAATTFSNSDDCCNVICNPIGKRGVVRFSKASKRSASLSDIYGSENIPPETSDMILEDLESCDITNLFYGIDVASPSIMSASLNELSTHEENMHSPSRVLRQAQNISFSDLRSPPIRLVGIRDSSLHSLHQDFEASKNDKGVREMPKGAVQGRYSKNAALLNKSKLSVNNKYRSKYFSSSQLDNLVTTNSIATQTAESQFSLQSNQSVTGDKKYHRVEKDQVKPTLNKIASAGQGGGGFAQSSFIGPPNSDSIADCQLCILVIGGQTDSPSFTAEPLKLWRCLLL